MQANSISTTSTSASTEPMAASPVERISTVRLLRIPRAAPKIEAYGFRLTRSKWDPYPWVCEVAAGTPASLRGLKAGDCILKINDIDILGMRIADVAKIVKSRKDQVTILCWNSNCQLDSEENSICCVPMPIALKRLVIVVDSILRVIECPVCRSLITPPVLQCQNGHLLCLECRIRTETCPICRGFFTPIRSSVAEEIYSVLALTFERLLPQGKFRQRFFADFTLVKEINCERCSQPNSRKTSSGSLKYAKFLDKFFHIQAAHQIEPSLNSKEMHTAYRQLEREHEYISS
ncbi:uncharacterized protein LOC6575381 [Drosophila mojavensis]|uniref:PDZ domain-containing protein n=1 Tax=Drosophila mojavensis TaxID=7230 RepID=B4KBC6_DROMO|nr:uncharacterized protein LOC6575381 [Drosophila mojavensis]EDW16854.1 uncharacterized protein Dmoj_GI22002 [Drosophila mojavensis]